MKVGTTKNMPWMQLATYVTVSGLGYFDIDMSYTGVLHPKVLHQRTAPKVAQSVSHK
jgi:hypothetical protein